MDYRKFYEQQTGVKLPAGYDVHHIDFNRENNEIRNLVALPQQLHTLYHFQCGILIIPFDHQLSNGISPDGHRLGGHNMQHLPAVIKAVETYVQCDKWVDYRDYLLGILPNVHNLKY